MLALQISEDSDDHVGIGVEPTIFSTTTTCYIMNNNSLFRSKLPFNDIANLVQHATSTITEYPINYFLLWIMWLKYLILPTVVSSETFCESFQ